MTAAVLTEPTAPEAPPPPSARGTGGWRVATRLARREVRRRWGRTLLVMLLVAIPVYGMTVLTVLVRTSRSTPAREFVRQFGQANLVGLGNIATPTGGWPAGTKVVTGHEVDTIGVIAGTTARLAQVTDIDLHNPLTRGAVLLRHGRFPTRAGEALLSPNLARAFHVGVGDTLKLANPHWTERVVGIGVRADNWNEGLLAVRGRELASGSSGFATDRVQSIALVQLPGHPTATQLQRYAPAYFGATTNNDGNDTQRAVDWTLVAGVIALGISGIVISGAFAVGARRQLVTLGQLSANGAGESLLRRMLSLQGAFCGALGTAAGLAAGVTTLVLMHGRFDTWTHRDIGPYMWSLPNMIAIAVTGVAAATIAAFVPARTAARVPVLSALAGRRPLGALPAMIVPIGIALFGGGVVVLGLVAAASRNGGGDQLAAAAVFGGLLVLTGACCVSPVVVASLTVVAQRVKGAGRVASRSLVRNRARSAAVVMALAAINAGAIAMSTAFASSTDKVAVSAPDVPDSALVIVHHVTDDTGGTTVGFEAVPKQFESALRTVLPDATWNRRRAVLGAHLATVGTGTPGGAQVYPFAGGDVAVVADPAVLHLVGLSHADAATLQRVGMLGLPSPDSDVSKPGSTVRVTMGNDANSPTVDVPVAADNFRATLQTTFLITPARARALGLPMLAAGDIVTNPRPFNESQRASIDALTASVMSGPRVLAPKIVPNGRGGNVKAVQAVPLTGGPIDFVDVLWSGPRSSGLSPNTVRQIVLAIVVAIALIVLAMSLALSAAETRDERDVLVALGSRPSTMRGVAAWKAGLLAFTGAALAIPTGFIPVAFAFYAAVRPGERAHLGFPWSTTLELVVVAPLIAAVIAAIGSGIAQHFRPTKMSTFATD